MYGENGQKPDWIMVPGPAYIELAQLLNVTANPIGAAIQRLKDIEEARGLRVIADALCDQFDCFENGMMVDHLATAMRGLSKLVKHPGLEQRLKCCQTAALKFVPVSQTPDGPAVV